ncbi:nucleoside hydrolase [Antribacter gilvus]|uniref:nucleoside hydrolase n=1 Tax=Antribacter gilvus TaxID=2304675 RepID=UPI000F7B2174|nr:nucleoside hydrolase [Antribacter gilvus]
MVRDLVVDTDATELNDDAFALYYLVGAGRVPSLITTVFGNSTARVSARVARELTHALGHSIPVAVGAERPLRWDDQQREELRKAITSLPADIYLASLNVANDPFWGESPDDGPAAAELAAFLEASPACDVLALGPVTNIARAVAMLDSAVLSRHHLWFSGGALHTGNVTGVAEFNAFADPDALRVCLGSAWARVTVVPLDVTVEPRLGIAEVERIRRAPTPFGKALDDLESRSPRGAARDREPIWDVVAAVLLDGSVSATVGQGRLTVQTELARRGSIKFATGFDVHDVVTAVDASAIVLRFEEAVS